MSYPAKKMMDTWYDFRKDSITEAKELDPKAVLDVPVVFSLRAARFDLEALLAKHLDLDVQTP